MRTDLTDLRVAAEITLWRRGWAAALASLMALAAVFVYLTVRLPAARARDAALLALEHERRRPPAPKPAETPATESFKRLQELRAALHRPADAPDLVRSMVRLAQAERISLPQAEYQQQTNTATGVIRVQLTQPVRATYPQLRRYIEAVLQATPNASLDQVTARRDNVTQSQLEARLKWSFWIYKTAPMAAAPTKDPAQ